MFATQNLPENQALIAAFARTYSDAKRLQAFRVAAVVALSVGAMIAAFLVQGWRPWIGGVGGVVLLGVSLMVRSVEKRQRLLAAATQEQFDTVVFKLPWNSLHAERPPGHEVHRAAARYTGRRKPDWYKPDTGTVHRPFDVLIYQMSNTGWGAAMHRRWAWTLTVATLAVLAVSTIPMVFGVSAAVWFLCIVTPFLAPLIESLEQIRENFEAARTKEAAERKALELWTLGLTTSAAPQESDLRALQDKILLTRQTNPYVPDWFDNLLRDTNEQAMSANAISRISEARRAGHAD